MEKRPKEKLEDFADSILQDIKAMKNPKFKTTTRTRSNTIYDKQAGFLRLGNATEEHTFINISQSKRFMQTMAIAAKCHSFIEQNLHTSIRGLFYQLKYSLGNEIDENLFNEQTESNPLIEEIELALNLRREMLNLNANRKGVLVGNMHVLDKFGDGAEIDMSKMGRSGWSIPSDVDNDIDFIDVKAKYVLVVEKDALWVRLNEDGFWKKENCILISTIGQAARGTRRLIRKFADMGLPVYVFNDGDVWGWYIYWTIKTGSMNLAYIGKDIATPEARFLGVTISDLDKYEFLKNMTMKATDFDLKRAQEMLKYPWINQHKEWVTELKLVIKTKLKLEQDSLQGPRLTFVDDYIKDKIESKSYLP